MQKSKEEIRKQFEDYIREYEVKIRLWSAVKRVTKKDGSDFQNFAKNFENAKIERGRICMDKIKKETESNSSLYYAMRDLIKEVGY